MSSIFQWLIYFLLRSEASNKAKPTITRWNKEIRTAYGNSLLPAIFYYEAKRVTKQSRLTPHRSQRYVSLTQAVNYRLFFYYEAQRVTKQSLPSPHRSQRHVSLTQVVNYRLFFYYEAQRVTNWFIQILFGARCGCIDSAARLF